MLRGCAFVLRICFARLFSEAGRAFLPAAVVLLGYVMAAPYGLVPFPILPTALQAVAYLNLATVNTCTLAVA